jgi:hypothetical protein
MPPPGGHLDLTRQATVLTLAGAAMLAYNQLTPSNHPIAPAICLIAFSGDCLVGMGAGFVLFPLPQRVRWENQTVWMSGEAACRAGALRHAVSISDLLLGLETSPHRCSQPGAIDFGESPWNPWFTYYRSEDSAVFPSVAMTGDRADVWIGDGTSIGACPTSLLAFPGGVDWIYQGQRVQLYRSQYQKMGDCYTSTLHPEFKDSNMRRMFDTSQSSENAWTERDNWAARP